MKHLIRFGLLLCTGFSMVGCDDTPLTDLSISRLELTQGASAGSTAVLVSERRTTLRVMLTSDSSYPVSGVVGRLSVAVDGRALGTDLAAVNEPVTVPAGSKASLVFILEAPTGISPSSDVDFWLSLSAPGQFLEGQAFDMTFGAPSIATLDQP